MEKTVINAEKKSWFPDFGELNRYRQLLFSLAWRDIRVKYAQTYIGLFWALINPVVNLVILSFVFGRIAQVDTQGVPHLLFTITGLAAWTYFSTLFSEAGNSIVGSQAMIKKIYFPRLVIPLSKALSGLIDFGITMICLLVIMIYYGIWPGANVIWLPLFILLALVSGLAVGIIASALTVRYRDFAFVVPMLVRIGMFATPIAYSSTAVPQEFKFLYFLNPMAGVVEGFRWSLLGNETLDSYMLFSISLMIILLFVGLFLFAKMERVMADIL